MAKAYVGVGHKANAEKHCRQILEMEPDSERALTMLEAPVAGATRAG